ncbi:hypothetical protein GCM10009603_18740 [Nocardiopsis exhalans]
MDSGSTILPAPPEPAVSAASRPYNQRLDDNPVSALCLHVPATFPLTSCRYDPVPS